MIFKDEKLNSFKYDPSIEVKDEQYSAYELCKELERIGDIILQYKSNRIELNTDPGYFNRIFIDPIVLERSTDDIYRIIFCNGEFLNRLNILNIERVFEDNRYYPEFLKLCYFFYIMTYFIFPKRRFFDLFKQLKWSAENNIEAETGNDVYEKYIMDNVFNDGYYHNLNNEYELLHDSFFEKYFDYYQNHYDNYEGNDFDDYINKCNKELIEKCNSIALKVKMEDSPYRRLLSFLKRYEALSTIEDMLRNTDEDIFNDARQILDKIDTEAIEKYSDEYIDANDWDYVFDKEMFLCSILKKDRLNFTDRIRLEEAKIDITVERIIAFEYFQYDLHNVKDGAFTFVKKDGDDFYINMADVYIIAAARFYLPADLKYYSKRTYLENRSDANNNPDHSIRRALKSDENDGFNKGKSTLVINIFRILCRMLKACIEEGEEEFYNFELPMNRCCIALQKEPENFEYLEARVKWYKTMNELL